MTPPKSGFRFRRLFQFRLRTLLVLLLLASLGMSGWHRYLESYREQQQAVAAIAKHARHIAYQPGRPAWMRHFSDERVFKDVVHLSFQSNRRFGDESMVHLAKMPRLARLSLQHTGVTDDGLRHLSKLTELDTLSLESTRVTDEGLKHLSQLSKLRRLQLNKTKVSGRGLAHLQDLQGLERLEIVSFALQDRDLESLLSLSRLKDLQMHGSQLSADGFTRLSSLRELERLDLHGNRIAELRLRDLPNLKSLTFRGQIRGLQLHDLPQLSQLTVSLPGDTSFQGLPRLQVLDLSGRQLRDGAIESLGSLSGLQTLDLSHVKILSHHKARESAWRHLASLPAVRDLRLGWTGINGRELQYLSKLQTLRVLTLAGNPLDGRALAHLRTLRDLKALDLSETRCFETGLEQSTPRGNLRDSRLFRTAVIPHTGLEHLLSLRRLETVNLSGTGVTVEEVVMLRELPRLDVLGLSAGIWNDDEIAAMASQLPTTTISYADRTYQDRSFLGFRRLMEVGETQYVPTQAEASMIEQYQQQRIWQLRGPRDGSGLTIPPVRTIVKPPIKLRGS